MLLPNIQEPAISARGTKTYRLDFENKRILGKTDGKEALDQWIKKILITEKNAFDIYTTYGCSLESLIGQEFLYASSMVKRNITEALLTDERILSVDNFEFERKKDSFSVSFIVNTIYGIYSDEVSL